MAEASPLSAASGGLRLAVRVVPKAQRSHILGLVDDARGGKALKIQLAAAPEGGKANDELISVLATALDLPRRDLALLAGAASRQKLIAIAGEAATLRPRVEALWA